MIFPLIILIKMKMMLDLADCFLTEMADKRAETGSLSDADPICYRPNKYDSLQIHIKA